MKLGALNAVIGKVHPKRAAPKPKDLGDLVGLSNYAQGLNLAVAGDSAEAKWELDQGGVVYRAWMSAVVLLGDEPQLSDAGANMAGANYFMIDNVSPMTPLPWHGGHGGGGFDSSGGTASPGNTGKQRLAQSGAKSGSGNGNDTISKARKITGGLSKGTSVAWRIGTGGGAPWGIPQAGVGKILDFNFDTWGKAADALAGDPPRGDFQQIAMAEKARFTPVTAGPKLSQARADAFNAFMDAALDLTGKLRAVTISLDRYGGALAAGDGAAADRQVRNAAKWDRHSGFAMLIVAEKLEALVKVCQDEGYQFPQVTAKAIKAHQDELRAKGFLADEVAAAKALGLTDEEIEECRQLRLRETPEDVVGGLDDLAAQQVDAFRELGKELILVPVVEVEGT